MKKKGKNFKCYKNTCFPFIYKVKTYFRHPTRKWRALKKDKKHVIVRVIVKELLGLELFDIKEKDSGFTAKGKNQREKACDYMVTVDGKTISLECNKNYDKRLLARNISHLRRAIIGEDFEIVQINIDNYDIGERNKIVYGYCIKEVEGQEKKSMKT